MNTDILPSTSVTLYSAASHKSIIGFWVIWEYEFWHQQCLEAVFEVRVTTEEVERVLELISLFSFQHVIYYRRAVSHEWTVILWLYEIHAESWEHDPIMNTSFRERSRHNSNNGSIYLDIRRWALLHPPAVLAIDAHFLFNTFAIHMCWSSCSLDRNHIRKRSLLFTRAAFIWPKYSKQLVSMWIY